MNLLKAAFITVIVGILVGFLAISVLESDDFNFKLWGWITIITSLVLFLFIVLFFQLDIL